MITPMCPECRGQGKHSNCTGWALAENDETVDCECTHEAGSERVELAHLIDPNALEVHAYPWPLDAADRVIAGGFHRTAAPAMDALTRAVHEVVYAPGASFDRADRTTQTYMRECAEKVAARAGLTFGASNPAQDRIEELLAWIEHTLKLPVFAHPKTDVAYEEIAHLKSWRNLLTNGLHPSARETLRKERA